MKNTHNSKRKQVIFSAPLPNTFLYCFNCITRNEKCCKMVMNNSIMKC